MSYTFKLPYNETNDRLGFGIDVLTNAIKGDGVIKNPETGEVIDLDESGFSHKVVTDNNSYMLAVEANLSAEGNLWGGEQSASAKFMYDSDIDVKSTSYVGNAYRIASKRELNLQTSKLTSSAKDFIREHGPDAFLDEHGLYFVGGFVYGGWCSIYYSMTAQTSSKKISAEAAVSAAFGKNKVDIDAALQTASKEYNLAMQGGADGASFGNHAPSDPNLCSAYMDLLDAANTYMNADGYEGTPQQTICYSWDQLSAFMDLVREYYPDWSYPDLTTSNAVDKLSGNYLQLLYFKKSLNAANSVGLYNENWKQDVMSELNVIESNFAKIDMEELAKLSQNLNSNRWHKYDVPNVSSAINALTNKTVAVFYGYHLSDGWRGINKIYSDNTAIQLPNGVTTVMTASWMGMAASQFQVEVEMSKGRFRAKVLWDWISPVIRKDTTTSVWLEDDGMGVQTGEAIMPDRPDRMMIKIPDYSPDEENKSASQLSEANHSA